MFALNYLAVPPPGETISLLEKIWLLIAGAGAAKLSTGMLLVIGAVAFAWWMHAKSS